MYTHGSSAVIITITVHLTGVIIHSKLVFKVFVFKLFPSNYTHRKGNIK